MSSPAPASISPPVVSIIMPAYNASATIAQAIGSVVAQSFARWELIVVDDGSSDATAAVAREAQQTDPRIVVDVLSTPSGSPAAPRNRALELARGEYMAFLDADDRWHREKLERQLRYLQAGEMDLCGTWVEVVDAQDRPLGRRTPGERVDYATLLRQNTLVCSSVLYRVGALGKPRFPPIGHEDYALWLQLAREGAKVAVMPECLTVYRVHKHSVSANKISVIPYYWRIYRQCEGLTLLHSLFATARYLIFAAVRALSARRR